MLAIALFSFNAAFANQPLFAFNWEGFKKVTRSEFRKGDLTSATLNSLIGLGVEIRDQNGQRTIEGVVLASQRERQGSSYLIKIRLFDAKKHEVRLLEYNVRGRNLLSVTVIAVPELLITLDRVADQNFKALPLLPGQNNVEHIERSLDLNKTVRVLYIDARNQLVAAEGLLNRHMARYGDLTASHRIPLQLRIENAWGVETILPPRIVKIYGSPSCEGSLSDDSSDPDN